MMKKNCNTTNKFNNIGIISTHYVKSDKYLPFCCVKQMGDYDQLFPTSLKGQDNFSLEIGWDNMILIKL